MLAYSCERRSLDWLFTHGRLRLIAPAVMPLSIDWSTPGIGCPTRLWHEMQSIRRMSSFAFRASMSGWTSVGTSMTSEAMYWLVVPSSFRISTYGISCAWASVLRYWTSEMTCQWTPFRELSSRSDPNPLGRTTRATDAGVFASSFAYRVLRTRLTGPPFATIVESAWHLRQVSRVAGRSPWSGEGSAAGTCR